MGQFVQESHHPVSPMRPSQPGVVASPWAARLSAPARRFLDYLVGLTLVPTEAVGPFLEGRFDRLHTYAGEVEIGRALVDGGLLTAFQLERVLTGGAHGLLLGNYLVLEQIGSGGMGLVYLGEHRLMRRRVAIKVLPVDDDCHASLRERFYGEMRVLAELNHPNIVQAFDAGDVPAPGPNMPALTYLVMELIAGGDLESYVEHNGPLSVAQACDWVRQASQGLQAAHDLHVVHRDVKPSNLLVDGHGHIKLVDFGLVRQFCSQLTDPRALLGSIEFMAPEQSYDPSAVGPEADIYGLGSTLFWLLTGEAPYPFMRNVGSALRALQRDLPRRLRDLRPDAPRELDDLIARMLSRDPACRPSPPLAISTALALFTIAPLRDQRSAISDQRSAGGSSSLTSDLRPLISGTEPVLVSGSREQVLAALAEDEAGRRRVLIVEDDPFMRELVRDTLAGIGCTCDEVGDGESALAAVARESFDLVLLDLILPGMNGEEVCRRLRENPLQAYLKIIFSGTGGPGELAERMPRGADDCVAKPFDVRQLRARVEHALRVKEGQDRMLAAAEQFRRANRQLELSLEASKADVRQAHDALLFTMAKMAESRDGETPGHLRRLQRYARVLAEEASREGPWAGLVDARFLQRLERCVPLHDIGKIGLPDHVLLKPGALTTAERALVEQHPLIGDRILEALGKEHGDALDFLTMARAIVRHHHERYDGKGYPDKLAGDAIPAAARLVAVADVYDALRRERFHKPAIRHAAAVGVILRSSPGQFDPTLLRAFDACHDQFERIFREVCE
ncbi:MAG: protein kinase [Planctomycetes bacterium]|nr:protein kinase [Planctomycetota bacterium]